MNISISPTTTRHHSCKWEIYNHTTVGFGIYHNNNDGQQKGSYPAPPAPTSFPSNYSDNFQSYNWKVRYILQENLHPINSTFQGSVLC